MSHGGHDGSHGHSVVARPGNAGRVETAVLHVGGMYRASEKDVVESVLSRRPGGACQQL